MKKTLKVKLTPTKEQAKSLLETIESFNDACNWIFRKSFEAGTPYQMKLHHLVYFEVRERFPALTSRMIVRAIARVSDSYRTEKKSLHSFKKHSARETSDDRVMEKVDMQGNVIGFSVLGARNLAKMPLEVAL